MLAEMRYNPNSAKPYGVYIKRPSGYLYIDQFADERIAEELAMKKSLLPDISYVVKYENGVKINENLERT